MGDKIGNFLPTPFWIYFIPILLSTAGFLPHESPTYDLVSQYVLPMALVLMLIGTPIYALIKLGPKATAAMALGTVTMLIAIVVVFALFTRLLPEEGYKQAAAILATWTGGSANMLAVKELISLSDASFAPLVIVDTILSYAWMALLIAGVSWQGRFDQKIGRATDQDSIENVAAQKLSWDWQKIILILVLGGGISYLMNGLGALTAKYFSLLSAKGWAILFSSTAAIFLAMTPLRKLDEWGSTKIGSFLLYVVLATIGSKTDLSAARQAPVFLMFGAVVLIVHGIMMILGGRFFKIPLFLLSTSSQANVGGPISAPIVAEIYQPGTAQIGVIMGVIGNVIGTYVGLLGAWLCHGLDKFFR